MSQPTPGDVHTPGPMGAKGKKKKPAAMQDCYSKSLTFEEALKFNQNHGKDGKFAATPGQHVSFNDSPNTFQMHVIEHVPNGAFGPSTRVRATNPHGFGDQEYEIPNYRLRFHK